MKTEEIIRKLETEWEIPSGFWGGLREGYLRVERYDGVLNTLRSIEVSGEKIDRHLVRLLWFIPRFMSWQDERVPAKGGDIKLLERMTNEIEALLFEILGMP